ncbi:GNAT family N-acetyltransferase [Nonomuraea sp. NPDC046802]|uniref:GNAT family N-acetyltransferase n=1 Tax=Nonomuraea sp. NPDC046802 TaxID=3154919 RepID=UPI0033F98AB0
MTHPTVERADNLYQIRVDGEPAGLAEFRDRDAQRVFIHVEITEAFRGKGLSSVLIEHALTHTREEGKRIVPICPAVTRYLAKHDEFTDITDPVDRDVLTWLAAGQ